MRNEPNPIVEKSMDFAIQIVKAYKYLCNDKKEFVLSNQLLRSGTSIGANIKEATNAESKADFIHKMQIALKEASESEYWIELLQRTGYFNDKQTQILLNKCQEIIRLLTSIVVTSKKQVSLTKIRQRKKICGKPHQNDID